MRLLLLELNEVNFDHVRFYAARGKLPVLAALIDAHGISETSSEKNYEELEPWIQWVTAHTGLSLAEHGVYRLGDIVKHDIPQVWELLEKRGLTVGAVAPMNAKNRCARPAFFIPDPWTPTRMTGPAAMKGLCRAISQAVNDNAQARLTPSSATWLVVGAMLYARPANYFRYLALGGAALRRRPWAKALILDQLLADIFVTQVRQKRPDFASLFLNAGAHIQHHYMFNSPAYAGTQRNPEWYLARDQDPVLEVYEIYDRILGQIQRAFPGTRLMIATGLHQDPHGRATFYWRLKDHAEFLRSIGVPFAGVEPRMSRDFIVTCADVDQAREAARILGSVQSIDNTALFEVDNRGTDLFVMLTWPHDIPADFQYRLGNEVRPGLREMVSFVAIKNGEHNGIGYLIDTAGGGEAERGLVPLADMPKRIAEACGVSLAG